MRGAPSISRSRFRGSVRVRPRSCGEEEVAVELVGVGSFGVLADEDVADPHVRLLRPAARPCRRRGSSSWARRGRRRAGAPVLTGVGEVDPVEFHLCALTIEDRFGVRRTTLPPRVTTMWWSFASRPSLAVGRRRGSLHPPVLDRDDLRGSRRHRRDSTVWGVRSLRCG